MSNGFDGFSLKNKRVYVAGHKGMVGSALMRRLAGEDCELLTVGKDILDLRDQSATFAWFGHHRPDVVFLAAARVGGILANSMQQADFNSDNTYIASNVIGGAVRSGVEKLLFLGSSCVYPKRARQPIVETDLLTGLLEPTNEGYALAKINGLKACEFYRKQHGFDFISAMPTNLYGPNDKFDLCNSHVLPSLMAKLRDAKLSGSKEVSIWGTGTPQREFLHVDDFADACVFLMQHYSEDMHINVGSGDEMTIRQLAELIARIIGWKGRFVFDTSRPDGTPRKLLDSSRLTALGWTAKTPLSTGIESTYRWLCDRYAMA